MKFFPLPDIGSSSLITELIELANLAGNEYPFKPGRSIAPVPLGCSFAIFFARASSAEISLY